MLYYPNFWIQVWSVIGKGSSIHLEFSAYFSKLQVLKIAILSEKYAHDYTWYVDTILNLIRLAGDYVSEEVWYRIVQVVINTQEVQGYAAKTCFEVRRKWYQKVCVSIDAVLLEIFAPALIGHFFPSNLTPFNRLP